MHTQFYAKGFDYEEWARQNRINRRRKRRRRRGGNMPVGPDENKPPAPKSRLGLLIDGQRRRDDACK